MALSGHEARHDCLSFGLTVRNIPCDAIQHAETASAGALRLTLGRNKPVLQIEVPFDKEYRIQAESLTRSVERNPCTSRRSSARTRLPFQPRRVRQGARISAADGPDEGGRNGIIIAELSRRYVFCTFAVATVVWEKDYSFFGAKGLLLRKSERINPRSRNPPARKKEQRAAWAVFAPQLSLRSATSCGPTRPPADQAVRMTP